MLPKLYLDPTISKKPHSHKLRMLFEVRSDLSKWHLDPIGAKCPRQRVFFDPQEDAGLLLQVLVPYENIKLNFVVHYGLLIVMTFSYGSKGDRFGGISAKFLRCSCYKASEVDVLSNLTLKGT